MIQKEVLRVMSLLEVQAVACGKTRIGGGNDGGYVMANDFLGNEVAYSIGVGPQVLWDEEMAERGLHIWQYDHTVDGSPQQHPNFHYQKLGIGPDLSDPELLTLEEMLARNGHAGKTNMLLKVDVEGAEWDVFDSMPDDSLERFDQIVIEYHGFEYMGAQSYRDRAERVFRKINRTHKPIHVHGNNYAKLHFVEGVPIASVYEISYARLGRFDFRDTDEIFPTSLDQPCDPRAPDIFLGNFRFR